MEDIKPHYRRKARKDGTTRKSRVFGKPWWFEKAGWTGERWNERRTAILERLREKWPDWSSFEQDAPTEDEIKQWIRSVVASFDDTSWCLPEATDPLERLEEQLSVYSAWAKFIIREASRFQMTRNLLDQDTASDGPQPPKRSVVDSKPNIVRRSTNSAKANGLSARDTRETIAHQWRQTRPSHSWTDQNLPRSEQQSRTSIPATKQKALINDELEEGTAHPPSRRPTDVADCRSSIVSLVPRGHKMVDTSDQETEMTEVSDSEPLRHAEVATGTPAGGGNRHDSDGRYYQKWQDSSWDDVVVTIDATPLNGEYFPIPITMLKPGSSRATCRWDDFELDDLYARFKVEAGFDIDRSRYVIVWSVNETSMVINTPGKYKLMLKEFAEKTRRSSAMVLCLRIIERGFVIQTPIRDVGQQNLVYGQERMGEKRSQFTGAASDFSSDSDSETTQPPLKRQKLTKEREPTLSDLESTADEPCPSLKAWSADQELEISPAQMRNDLSKVRDSPEEFTQDSI